MIFHVDLCRVGYSLVDDSGRTASIGKTTDMADQATKQVEVDSEKYSRFQATGELSWIFSSPGKNSILAYRCELWIDGSLAASFDSLSPSQTKQIGIPADWYVERKSLESGTESFSAIDKARSVGSLPSAKAAYMASITACSISGAGKAVDSHRANCHSQPTTVGKLGRKSGWCGMVCTANFPCPARSQSLPQYRGRTHGTIIRVMTCP